MIDWKFWVIAAVSLLGVAGCGTPATAPAGGKEIVTASDESDTRRRARLRVELASGYFERGQPTTALDEVKQALSVDPNYADAYTLRGLIYMQLGQPEVAEESFRKALSLEPRNADALHNYGWFLCRANRLNEAFNNFKAAEAVPNYPGAARTYLAHGVCQMQAGLMPDAEKSLYRSFELDPSNPATATNLALLHYRKGDYERARFYARKVNNSDDANAESLWLGMRIEKNLGNLLAVNELAGQLRKRFPDSRQVRLYDQGRWDEQ